MKVQALKLQNQLQQKSVIAASDHKSSKSVDYWQVQKAGGLEKFKHFCFSKFISESVRRTFREGEATFQKGYKNRKAGAQNEKEETTPR